MESASDLDPRRFSAARPPVMLLGGLSTCRALGLAGIPVVVASSGPHQPAFASRYCLGQLRLPSEGGRRAIADTLLAAGERLSAGLGRRVPLFYGNDDWQRLVQDYRTELAAHYALLLNDVDVADAVIDKDRFQPLALARGLPVPRALDWDSVGRVGRPVLVKPRAKSRWDLPAAHLRLFGPQGKARIFPSGSALLADPDARQLRNELLIQEYVAGDDRQIWSFHGFADENGLLLDWFIGRKIRTYPALTGMSTYVELAHNDELAALGRRIAAAMPLKGIFKIDLKRDPHIGRFRVLEVNARYNLWHYLGAANRVNLPRAAYRYLVYGERPLSSSAYRTTQRWIYLRYDWRAYRELAARGELGFLGWLASLAVAPKVCQLFSWRDPLPFLDGLYRRVRARLPRLPAALRKWRFTVF